MQKVLKESKIDPDYLNEASDHYSQDEKLTERLE